MRPLIAVRNISYITIETEEEVEYACRLDHTAGDDWRKHRGIVLPLLRGGNSEQRNLRPRKRIDQAATKLKRIVVSFRTNLKTSN